MSQERHSEANRLLGYPADARLLLINADDFGMYPAINAAVVRAFRDQDDTYIGESSFQVLENTLSYVLVAPTPK